MSPMLAIASGMRKSRLGAGSGWAAGGIGGDGQAPGGQRMGKEKAPRVFRPARLSLVGDGGFEPPTPAV